MNSAALSPHNEHPDFHIRGMVAALASDTTVPGEREVQNYVEEVRRRLVLTAGHLRSMGTGEAEPL